MGGESGRSGEDGLKSVPPAPPLSVPADYPIDAPDPVALGDEAVLVHLPDFEGPLDLLLHVIRKEELSILDIKISLVTERYLHYIRLMQALNLDIAGEYLLMAATLAYLKSRELIPPEPGEGGAETEEEEDPSQLRAQLIHRLLEYQKFKDAAVRLGERPVAGRNVWVRGAPIEQIADLPPTAGTTVEEIPIFDLVEALSQVLSRARVEVTHDVVVERVSIADRIHELVERLSSEGTFTFSSCFAFLEEGGGLGQLRERIVVTFLAVLEMARLHLLRIYQATDQGDIYMAQPMPVGGGASEGGLEPAAS